MPYVHGESIIRIAFADDDLTLYELLGDYFDRIENCKVLIRATNGKELLEKIKRKPEIDLVITDIRMPEMDGYELTKQIKKIILKLKFFLLQSFIMRSSTASLSVQVQMVL
jgi:two-component system response regulator NreC